MTPTAPLDLHWVGHPRSIASALLRDNHTVALIDPGPGSTISTLRQHLAQVGLRVSDLNFILLTHIHLDHAGATGALVRENPALQVFVHQRGAPHMTDPAKLLSSAARLYGDEMQRLYGDFLPVPQENLRVLEGGESISLASRRLSVLYTPGHASHHVTFFDSSDGTAFVGDTAGISVNGHPYVLPATPPPDINFELWEQSLNAIEALRPRRLFLTHFSFSDNPERHLASYRERLAQWRELSARILETTSDESAAMHRFAQDVAADAARFLTPQDMGHYVFNGALNLSWLGLARYHRKRAQAEPSAAPH
ncbi:MAG TPA: MBL fold metallo-hydrolase [Methylomirabilota bacterium]|nr:MBL fold metallo-hydrolase [Methylomirabilota bacterium]